MLWNAMLVAFAMFTGPSTALATPLSDFYITQALDRYFVLPMSAESLALGGSISTTCRGADCLYMNPAGLGFLPTPEISGTVGYSLLAGEDFTDRDNLEQNEYHGYGVLAWPLGPTRRGRGLLGTFAAGYSRYDGHTDDSIHTRPDGHRRSLGYGYAPSEDFAAGYSFTFYDDQLHSEFADLHSHSRLLHVWGAEYRPTDDIELGGLFQLGIGQSDTEDFRFDSNGLSHLRQYSGQIGARQHLSFGTASISFDYSRVQSRGDLDGVALPVVIGGSEAGNLYNIRAGYEHRVGYNLALRGGFRWYEVESYEFKRADLEDLSGTIQGLGFTLGLGWTFRKSAGQKNAPSLSYGSEYLKVGNGTWEHLLTFNVPFQL